MEGTNNFVEGKLVTPPKGLQGTYRPEDGVTSRFPSFVRSGSRVRSSVALRGKDDGQKGRAQDQDDEGKERTSNTPERKLKASALTTKKEGKPSVWDVVVRGGKGPRMQSTHLAALTRAAGGEPASPPPGVDIFSESGNTYEFTHSGNHLKNVKTQEQRPIIGEPPPLMGWETGLPRKTRVTTEALSPWKEEALTSGGTRQPVQTGPEVGAETGSTVSAALKDEPPQKPAVPPPKKRLGRLPKRPMGPSGRKKPQKNQRKPGKTIIRTDQRADLEGKPERPSSTTGAAQENSQTGIRETVATEPEVGTKEQSSQGAGGPKSRKGLDRNTPKSQMRRLFLQNKGQDPKAMLKPVPKKASKPKGSTSSKSPVSGKGETSPAATGSLSTKSKKVTSKQGSKLEAKKTGDKSTLVSRSSSKEGQEDSRSTGDETGRSVESSSRSERSEGHSHSASKPASRRDSSQAPASQADSAEQETTSMRDVSLWKGAPGWTRYAGPALLVAVAVAMVGIVRIGMQRGAAGVLERGSPRFF